MIEGKLKHAFGSTGHVFQGRSSNPILDGINSGVANARQRIDAFTNDLKHAGSRPASSLLANFIAGLDGQIDNLIGVVGKVLSPVSGGLSESAVHVILGPTIQSITDGVEVLLGNVAGAPIDLLLAPALHMLSGNMKNVAHVAKVYNMKDLQEKLAQQENHIRAFAEKGTSIVSRGGFKFPLEQPPKD
jgi:hypothetical protein